MKYFKYYVIGLFVILLLSAVFYMGLKVGIRQPKQSTEEIEQENTVEIKAEVDETKWQAKLDSLQNYHDNNPITIFADPPKTDDDITKWWEEEIFVVDDPIPIVNEVIDNETRTAITHYKYSDALNDYSMTLKIKYDYKHTNFIIEPQELNFKPEKVYPFCFSAVLHSNSAGVRLDWDFWRIRLGSGVYITKEINPIVGVSVGFRF